MAKNLKLVPQQIPLGAHLVNLLVQSLDLLFIQLQVLDQDAASGSAVPVLLFEYALGTERQLVLLFDLNELVSDVR